MKYFRYDKSTISYNFDRASETYGASDCIHHNIAKDVLSFVVSRCCVDCLYDKSILEIGCGTGVLTSLILENLYPSQMICNDLSERMLGCVTKQHQGIFTICGDAEDIDFPFCNLVISSMAFQWFNDLYATVRKIKDNANIMVFSMPVFGTFCELYQMYDRYGLEFKSVLHEYEDVKRKMLMEFAGNAVFCDIRQYSMKFASLKCFYRYLWMIGANYNIHNIAQNDLVAMIMDNDNEFTTCYDVMFCLVHNL